MRDAQTLKERDVGLDRAAKVASLGRLAETVLTRGTAYAVVGMIAAMVVVIWISVFTRYVMNDPVSWGEQVAKYLMVWGTFLGASLGLREGSHISVNLLVDMFPSPLRKLCSLAAFLIVAAFLSVGMVYGALFTYQSRNYSDPLVGEMSMAIPYAAIPVGCALMLMQLLCTYWKGARQLEEVRMAAAAE